MKRLIAILLSLGMLGILAAPVAAARPAQPTQTSLNDIPVTGTLPGGGTFTGLLDITSLDVVNGVLTASGTLTGVATQGTVVTNIVQEFTNVALGLLNPNGGVCDILQLDIGAIHLDLLGLVVDLAPIHLNVDAVPGAGNLLGNLLCAVAGLLDGPNPIGNLLNNLLGILNGLLG